MDLGADRTRAVLDKTAFYPTSGGQPNDLGAIGGIPVIDVIDEDDRVVHVLERPLANDTAEVDCTVEWTRRWDHMQQHTGQHLLSAVLADLYGMQTVSFHMGAASSTIDLETSALSAAQIEAAEARANAVIHENRPVGTSFEDAATVTGLRKPTGRAGIIRVVTIDALDRSACGGTHVRSTGEIGVILLRSIDKIRGNLRLEFVCGRRAVETARSDYNALDRAARAFSAKLDEVPQVAASMLERLKEAEKTRRKLEMDLADFRGRALYSETAPSNNGVRIFEKLLPTGPLGEEIRNEANAFTAGAKSVYIAIAESPASAMLAASPDANVHCGNVLKQALANFGGRGGGSQTMAQGSFTGDTRGFARLLRDLLTAG